MFKKTVERKKKRVRIKTAKKKNSRKYEPK